MTFHTQVVWSETQRIKSPPFKDALYVFDTVLITFATLCENPCQSMNTPVPNTVAPRNLPQEKGV